MAEWMDNARERMGDEQFEQFISMRERPFGAFGRGAKPDNIPGAERFSPDYDGPVPDRNGFSFFGGRERIYNTQRHHIIYGDLSYAR